MSLVSDEGGSGRGFSWALAEVGETVGLNPRYTRAFSRAAAAAVEADRAAANATAALEKLLLLGSESDDECLSLCEDEGDGRLLENVGGNVGGEIIASPDEFAITKHQRDEPLAVNFKVVMDWTPRTVTAAKRMAARTSSPQTLSPDLPRPPRPSSPEFSPDLLSPAQRASATVAARAAAAAFSRARAEGVNAADAASAAYVIGQRCGQTHNNDMAASRPPTSRPPASAKAPLPTAWPGRGVAPEPEPAPSLDMATKVDLQPALDPEPEPEVENSRSRRSSASELSEADQATSKLIATALFRVATTLDAQNLLGFSQAPVEQQSWVAGEPGHTDHFEPSLQSLFISSSDGEAESPASSSSGEKASPRLDLGLKADQTAQIGRVTATPSVLQPILKDCSTGELIKMMQVLNAQNHGQVQLVELDTPPAQQVVAPFEESDPDTQPTSQATAPVQEADVAPLRQTLPSNPASVFQRKKRYVAAAATAATAATSLALGPDSSTEGSTSRLEECSMRSEISSTRRRVADLEHAARLHDEHQQRLQRKVAKRLEAERLKEKAEMEKCSFDFKPSKRHTYSNSDSRAVEDRLMEYGRLKREARSSYALNASQISRQAQKSGKFEKRLHDQDIKHRGSARKKREAQAAKQAQREADKLAARTVKKKHDIDFDTYSELHGRHQRTQQKLIEKREQFAQEELDNIRKLQKDAGMKVQVIAAGSTPRVAGLPSTAKKSEIGKMHRQLAESACVKQRGTGPGTTHFLRTSTKDPLYKIAIETALKDERARSSRGVPEKKVAGSQRKQRSPQTRLSPAMERLTRPRTPTLSLSPEELPGRSSRFSGSSPTATSKDSASRLAVVPAESTLSSTRNLQTLTAPQKRAMSPILRRSVRGKSVKPAASAVLASTMADPVSSFPAESFGQRWCKRCSAAFTAESCLQNHPVEQYCALPLSSAKPVLDDEAVRVHGLDMPVGSESQSVTQQLDAALQSLEAGPGGQNTEQAVAQERAALPLKTAGDGESCSAANDSFVVKPDIHKLAISSLKLAVAADTEYKDAQSSGAESSSLLHAAIAAYKRAEELLAAVQESDTVKKTSKRVLQSKIQPTIARRTALERVAQKALERSADFVASAKEALSETEWGAARIAEEHAAAAAAIGSAAINSSSPRAARPKVTIEHWLQEVGGHAYPIVDSAFKQLGLVTLADIAAYARSGRGLQDLFPSADLAELASEEVELITLANAGADSHINESPEEDEKEFDDTAEPLPSTRSMLGTEQSTTWNYPDDQDTSEEKQNRQAQSWTPNDSADKLPGCEATDSAEVSGGDLGDSDRDPDQVAIGETIGSFSSPPSDRTSVTMAEKSAALAWVGSVLGRPDLCHDAELQVLRDGTLLCALVNALRPGSVQTISDSTMPFHQRVNIQAFLDSLHRFGVPKGVGFETADLYEDRNPRAVIHCIDSLKHAVDRELVESTSSNLPTINGADGSAFTANGDALDSFTDLEAAISGGSSSGHDDSTADGNATGGELGAEGGEQTSELVHNPVDSGSDSSDEDVSSSPGGAESAANPIDHAIDGERSIAKNSASRNKSAAPLAQEELTEVDPFAALASIVSDSGALSESDRLSDNKGEEKEEQEDTLKASSLGSAFDDLEALLS